MTPRGPGAPDPASGEAGATQGAGEGGEPRGAGEAGEPRGAGEAGETRSAEEARAPQGPAKTGAPSRAADFLRPVLLSLIERVRTNAERVISAGAHGPGDAPDDEAVHDFRVALRRLRTLLRPARRVFGKKRLRSIADGLREFASATGALRDEEVLRETLAALELDGDARAAVDAWLSQQAQREQEARAQVRALLLRDRSGKKGARDDAGRKALRLSPHLDRLERRVRRRKARKQRAEKLARRTVADALGGVRALATRDPEDSAAMHALRIRCKRLRYSAEAFAPLLGERAERTAKSASRLQRRLGQLHDLDEAIARMSDAEGLAPAQREAVVGALRAERERVARRVVEEISVEQAALAALWPDVDAGPAA